MDLRELVHELIMITVIHRCRVTKSALKVGLHFGQPMILEYVIEHDSCTQKELAAAMHISPASVATTLKRIEKAGLITRSHDCDDTRKNHVSVTEKGVNALKEYRKICDAADEDMFRGFSDEERETLHNLLVRLHRNLDTENFTREEIDSLLKKSSPPKGASEK